jgi:amino acid transporter
LEFIAIGGTLGIGFATTTGEVLAMSGNVGILVAFAVVGVVMIAVMEGICEMVKSLENTSLHFVLRSVNLYAKV